MRKSTLMMLLAAGITSAMGIAPAIAPAGTARVVTERRRKAQKSLKKTGRAPVSMAEREIIDAAEAKRERKAAKYARDMERMKGQGR